MPCSAGCGRPLKARGQVLKLFGMHSEGGPCSKKSKEVRIFLLAWGLECESEPVPFQERPAAGGGRGRESRPAGQLHQVFDELPVDRFPGPALDIAPSGAFFFGIEVRILEKKPALGEEIAGVAAAGHQAAP